MHTWRFYACMVVLLLSLPRAEARPLTPYIEGRNLIASIQAVAKTMEALKKGELYGFTNKSLYDSERQSPGGPDPQHH